MSENSFQANIRFQKQKVRQNKNNTFGASGFFPFFYVKFLFFQT